MSNESTNSWKIIATSVLAIVLSFLLFPFFVNSAAVVIISIIILISLFIRGSGIARLFIVLFSIASILLSAREAQLISQGHLEDLAGYQHDIGISDTLDKENILPADNFITNEDGWLVANPEKNDWINSINPRPINSEGFRSMEFDTTLCRDKKRVLFLGDSFTFGTIEDNCIFSYADILDGKYCTFNSGIPSTDLPQYLSIAEKLIPRIKPDFVCLMFCEENDFIGFEREISANKPVVYITNVGAFPAYFFNCSCNRHLSFQEAISCYFEQENPFRRNGWIEKYCTMTRIWSDIYLQIKDLVVSDPECSLTHNLHVTREYLKRIQFLSVQHEAEFLLFIIPDKKALITDDEKFRSAHSGIFDSLELHIPVVTASDYLQGNNIHFNELGNQKMALLIEQVIERSETHRIPTK